MISSQQEVFYTCVAANPLAIWQFFLPLFKKKKKETQNSVAESDLITQVKLQL